MKRFDILDSLVKQGNGYLCTSQALKHGVSKPTMAHYVRKRNMERVAHGVYLAEDAWPDTLYQLHLSNSRIIFSHETALMLHGLTEREPHTAYVTVCAGYNATHLRKKGIQVYQDNPNTYQVGIANVKTFFGNTVLAYDMERTICGIIRSKKTMDIQVFRYAMREYMMSAHKNLPQLARYARLFHIEPTVRLYTEVLL